MRTAGLLLLLAGTARADIVPPDSKAITHRVRFENLREHPDFVFYVHPRDFAREQPGNSSVRVGEKGEAVLSALNPMAGPPHLYAVPAALHAGRELPDEAWFKEAGAAGVRSARLVAPQKYVSRSAPFDTLETRYRVQGLPASLDLVPLGEEMLAGGVPVHPFRVLWFLLALPLAAAAWIAFRVYGRRAVKRP